MGDTGPGSCVATARTNGNAARLGAAGLEQVLLSLLVNAGHRATRTAAPGAPVLRGHTI